jgi:hypothetical protein
VEVNVDHTLVFGRGLEDVAASRRLPGDTQVNREGARKPIGADVAPVRARSARMPPTTLARSDAQALGQSTSRAAAQASGPRPQRR